MTASIWTRTTRTATRVPGAASRPDQLLAPGELVQSPEGGLAYRVERLIGAGGFGQAFLARRIGRAGDVPAHVCLKVSTRLDGWVREAYFGQVLDGHDRAIRVFDAFPVLRAD